MNYNEVAKKLVEAESESQLFQIIKANSHLADVNLAVAIKEICYDSWTKEPTKAQKAAVALRALENFTDNRLIEAYAFWIEGISSLTKGENQIAIERLNLAFSTFVSIGEDHLAAQTQVSKIYLLSLLGNYEEAIEVGKAALQTFEKLGDLISSAKVKRNLGNILYRGEKYAEAEGFYQLARKSLSNSEFQSELAMVENSLAVVKALQNDFRESEKLYESAFAHAETAGLKVTQAEIEASRGNLALFRGKLEEALQFLESSRRRFAELKMPHQTAIAELEVADLYLELNLLPEAKEIYERVAPQFAALKMQAEEARTRTNFGRTLIALKLYPQAKQQLREAARLYQREGNVVGASYVNLLEARLSLLEKRFAEAESLAEIAEKVFADAGNVRNRLLASLLRGEAQRLSGEVENARKTLEKTLREALKSENPHVELASLNALGHISVAANDFSQAQRFFTQAIEKIEEMRSPLPSDEFRAAFFADKLTPFHEIARINLAQGKIETAFEFTEKARARALLDLLNRQAEEIEVLRQKNQADVEALREELNWFYSRLNRPPMAEAKVSAEDFSVWQTSARKLEKQIHELTLQTQAHRTSNSKSSPEFEIAGLQKQLGTRRALIEYAEMNGEIVAFVITNERIEIVKIAATENQIKDLLQKVHFQFAALRHSPEKIGKHLNQLKVRVKHHLKELENILLTPLKSVIEGKDLVFVPFGVLHYVPFHALFDGNAYLIEHRQVSYAPSASVLQLCLERKTQNFEKALIVGFADERIPEVEKEVQNLAEILPQTEVLIGEEAKFSALKSRAAQADILHLACHAQFRAENPLFSSLHLADGWANVRDVSQLRLKNSLVTLSACETGWNAVANGEELIGVVRGFLSAGASALILSLWTVQDAATVSLMKKFYRHLKSGNTLAESLRQAQLQFIQEDVHPYFWSPFILVGHW